jgi:TonB family protein
VALAVAAAAPPLRAQEEPLVAGSEGVPAPKRTKHVQPNYPAEALAQGIRGIVILDIVLDVQGKVESTTVMRSVPGLDEAAIAAARQWEYAPTKVDGKPVRVRVTVPVVFSLALPTLQRQAGVPELRQGVGPAWPAAGSGGGLATAEVTLEPDGRVGVARILEGGAPWSDALLAALKTWRFTPPPEEEVLSFRVEAEFVPGKSQADRKVNLQATGLQRAGLMEEAAPPPSPAAPATAVAGAAPRPQEPPSSPAEPAPTQASPAQPPAPAPAVQEPPVQPAPAQEPPVQALPAQSPPAQAPPAQAVPAPPAAVPTAPAQARPAPAEARPATQAAAPPAVAAPPSGSAAPPPVEVITAPPPALPPENGVSAVRDVTLDPGVPDLSRGRRPVAPPLARMTGTTGTVEVTFSVGAGGTTTIQSATGPDLLKAAAEQAVASWLFRRARGPGLPGRRVHVHRGQGLGGRAAPGRSAGGRGGAPPAVAGRKERRRDRGYSAVFRAFFAAGFFSSAFGSASFLSPAFFAALSFVAGLNS